ncbi:hypothetical protein DXG03_000655 [Asterophora parasitica]|uniref:Metallo-beta-lactamase domain-containing protein n=1 Tax=Asterophora parasitica TaxID=117018 RepID=A0A9P7KD72_9AGAR|nr:hypothetical protein DXG03_000655 [Asterophora parasitica]
MDQLEVLPSISRVSATIVSSIRSDPVRQLSDHVVRVLGQVQIPTSSAPQTPTPFSPTGPHTTHGAPNLLPSILSSLSANSYTPSPSGDAFHDLHDDQVLSSQVRILHTPGHTTDSISLYIPQDKALYTADTVLGQGTAVFEDLSLYLASLRKMLEFSDGDGYTILYPGHGPIVKNGKEIITGYIHHRLDREAQILKVLQRPPPAPTSPSGSEDVGAVTGTDAALAGESTYWSTWTIVTTMYAAYPESLWLPAAHGVDLHLKKLEQDGVVRRVKAGGEGQRQHTTWELAGALPTELEPVPVDRLGKY